MKQCFVLFLTIVLALSMTGCGAAHPGEGGSAELPEGSASDISGEEISAGSVSEEHTPPQDVSVPDKSVLGDYATVPEPVQPPAEDARNDRYFDNALFIGDSIMEGIRQYVAMERKQGEVLGQAKFLATTSGITLADLVGDRQPGICYRYKGEEKPLEQIVSDLAPQRIFLLLGLNDLSGEEPDVPTALDRYSRLIVLMQTICPQAEIVVMTNPPKVASGWLPNYTHNRNFNNDLIDEFVNGLIKLCARQGIAYIDTHADLENDAGALPDDWCRDGYVHLSNSGSAVVVEALYEFAEGKE